MTLASAKIRAVLFESPRLGYRPTQSCSTWWHPLLFTDNAAESWSPERLGAVFLAVSTGIGGFKTLPFSDCLSHQVCIKPLQTKPCQSPELTQSCKCKQKKGQQNQTRRTIISTTLGHERTSHSSSPQYQLEEWGDKDSFLAI